MNGWLFKPTMIGECNLEAQGSGIDALIRFDWEPVIMTVFVLW